MSFIVGIIMTLLFFKKKINDSLIVPLKEILENINLIKKGTYTLNHTEFNNEEMQEISNALVVMADKITISLQIEKDKANLEKVLAQSELRMLQNQINPHFLFNTLNMIYCIAEKEDANTTSEMILKTCEVLRYGLNKSNKVSNLKNEIEILKCYIDIQKMRFQDKIKFQLEIYESTDMELIPIPGMILQPLVENAIIHGLKNYLKKGTIDIYINKVDNMIDIVISDNGEGMKNEELEKLIMNDFYIKGKNSLGLANVIHRLRLYFGDEVKFEFESDEGCGFTIRILIYISCL